jgi:mono/diheme cytochrome c family protein
MVNLRVRRVLIGASLVALAAVTTIAAGGQRSTADKPQSLLRPSLAGADNYTSYCAPCHGSDGRGHGPVAPALTTPPADLTKLASRNNGVFPRTRVQDFVTNGTPAIAAHGSSAMPVWGPTFRSLDSSDKLVTIRIANVIAYLESIQQ